MRTRRFNIWFPIVTGVIGVGVFFFLFIALFFDNGPAVNKDTIQVMTASLVAYSAFIGLGLILKDTKELATVRKVLFISLAMAIVCVLLPNILALFADKPTYSLSFIYVLYIALLVRDLRNTAVRP